MTQYQCCQCKCHHDPVFEVYIPPPPPQRPIVITLDRTPPTRRDYTVRSLPYLGTQCSQFRECSTVEKRQVRFDLSKSSPRRRHSPASSAEEPHKPPLLLEYHQHETPPPSPHPRALHDAGQHPLPHPPPPIPRHPHHHQQQQPRSILRPPSRPSPHPNPSTTTSSLPTIYILTFSKYLAPTPSSHTSLRAAYVPPHTPHLSTLDVSHLPVPPDSLCKRYSGVAPIVQDWLWQQPHVRECVDMAMQKVLAWLCTLPQHGLGHGHAAKRGNGNARSVSICCANGVHRSVAVAEMVAQGVKGEVGRVGGMGVRVVCRHLSRVKFVGDEF